MIRRRPVPGGQETIMVVEDERDLRELVCEILQSYKYNVVDAANGAEALEVWEKHNGRIDLLLTDIVMPEGMDGYELATHLCKKKPGLKVIYTSGYNGAMAEAGQRNAPFLAKPYRPAALGELIRATLNGTAQK
jgi:CheY-like chemotaxis protein